LGTPGALLGMVVTQLAIALVPALHGSNKVLDPPSAFEGTNVSHQGVNIMLIALDMCTDYVPFSSILVRFYSNIDSKSRTLVFSQMSPIPVCQGSDNCSSAANGASTRSSMTHRNSFQGSFHDCCNPGPVVNNSLTDRNHHNDLQVS
jgi:hypothetical protein